MSKWPLAKLGNVATVVGGGTPKTGDSENWDGTVPWVTPKDLSTQKSQYIERGVRHITETGLSSCSATLVPAGTVLWSSRAPIGLTAIARNPICTNQGFKNFVPNKDQIDSKYLYHFLRFNAQSLQTYGSGATFKEVSAKRAREITIPLPPLDEQRRIADILDVAARLKETFERKLNSSRRYFEFELSECIEAAHGTKKCIEIARLTGGSTPTKGNPEYWTNGTIPWFSTKDLKSDILTDSVDHVTEKAIASTLLKKITNATVALSIRGMSLAHRVPMSIIPGGSTINQDLKVIDSDLPYSPNLWLAILTHKEQHLLSKVATSAHGTKRLEVSQILDLDIPIFEDAQLAKIEKLAKLRAETLMSFDQILDNATELYNSLATRAFAGEL